MLTDTIAALVSRHSALAEQDEITTADLVRKGIWWPMAGTSHELRRFIEAYAESIGAGLVSEGVNLGLDALGAAGRRRPGADPARGLHVAAGRLPERPRRSRSTLLRATPGTPCGAPPARIHCCRPSCARCARAPPGTRWRNAPRQDREAEAPRARHRQPAGVHHRRVSAAPASSSARLRAVSTAPAGVPGSATTSRSQPAARARASSSSSRSSSPVRTEARPLPSRTSATRSRSPTTVAERR